MGEGQNKKSTTLVLLGKTGSGKSSTGNTILGKRLFKAAGAMTSVTKKCEMQTVVRNDGRVLNVVDTPGLFDTETSQEVITNEIKRCIDLAKDGVHAVLLLLSLSNRFTPEEAAVPNCLEIIFGTDILKYTVVVFTSLDQLDEEEGDTFEGRLNSSPPALKEFLKRCDNRIVAFNNKLKLPEMEKQLNELLKKVDNIIAANGGLPYSNALFEKYQTLQTSLLGQKNNCMSQSGTTINQTAELLRQINETVENRVNQAVRVMQEQLALERAAHQKTLDKMEKLNEDIVRLDEKKKDKGCIIL